MVVITPAAPAHLPEAARTLAAAFRDDDLMSRFVPADRHTERLAHLFAVMLRSGMRHGRVDLARAEGNPTVLGVAIWTAPGRHRTGPIAALADLRDYWRAFGASRLLPAARLDQKMQAAHPGDPHWYLAAIGVHPDGYGQGIGSALLDSRLSAVDRESSPAYLEASTHRSAALYARYGFTSTGAVSGLAASEPIAMWRTPQPA